ncbi:hypothetical protein GCM10029976_041310 [Kribbella albertanoniae]
MLKVTGGPRSSPNRFGEGWRRPRGDAGRIHPPNPSRIHPKPVWGGRSGDPFAADSPNVRTAGDPPSDPSDVSEEQ